MEIEVVKYICIKTNKFSGCLGFIYVEGNIYTLMKNNQFTYLISENNLSDYVYKLIDLDKRYLVKYSKWLADYRDKQINDIIND